MGSKLHEEPHGISRCRATCDRLATALALGFGWCSQSTPGAPEQSVRGGTRGCVLDTSPATAMFWAGVRGAATERSVASTSLRRVAGAPFPAEATKKMVEAGYLAHERSLHDRRSSHVKLTGKGGTLRDRLRAMQDHQVKILKETAIPSPSGSTQSAMTTGIGDRLKASSRGADRRDRIDGVARRLVVSAHKTDGPILTLVPRLHRGSGAEA